MPAKCLYGKPLPADLGPATPPTASGQVRSCDSGGCGHFLASRFDQKHKTIRFHVGVDYLNTAGDPVYVPITGYVKEWKNPGRGLKGVEIRAPSGYRATVFYVQPTAIIQQSLDAKIPIFVTAGSLLGTAQDIHAKGPDGKPPYDITVPQHVHVSLHDIRGRFVPPDGRAVVKPR